VSATDPHQVFHRTIEAVWRIESALVIAGLTRLTRDLDLAEDLAQEALVAALEQWPQSGVPDNPAAWLTATAKRRAIDLFRRNAVAERKHEELARELEALEQTSPDLDSTLDLRRVTQPAFRSIDCQSPGAPSSGCRGPWRSLLRSRTSFVRGQNRVVPWKFVHPAPDADVLPFDDGLVVRLEPELELGEECDRLGADMACRDRRLAVTRLTTPSSRLCPSLVSDEVQEPHLRLQRTPGRCGAQDGSCSPRMRRRPLPAIVRAGGASLRTRSRQGFRSDHSPVPR
jgi:hypothetical protein